MDHVSRQTAFDSLDNTHPLAFELGQFIALIGGVIDPFASQSVQMLGIFFAEQGAKLRVHQLALQRAQDILFQVIAADGQGVIACPFVAGAGAADLRTIQHRATATALAAFDQIRKQRLGAACVPKAGFCFLIDSTLLLFDCVPCHLVDDPQIGHVFYDPLVFWVEP